MVVVDSPMVSGCFAHGEWSFIWGTPCSLAITLHNAPIEVHILHFFLVIPVRYPRKRGGSLQNAHCPVNFIFQNASPFVEDRFCFIMCTPDTRHQNSAGSFTYMDMGQEYDEKLFCIHALFILHGASSLAPTQCTSHHMFG